MYSFSVFDKSGTEPRADAVVCGIKTGLLPAAAAAELEEAMIAGNGINAPRELLAFDGSSDEAVNALAKAGYVDDDRGRDVLRYAVLASLDSVGRNLLDSIEGVHTDFGYPRDMESFVYHMPNENNSSVEDLIKSFHEFLASEKTRLEL